MSGLTAFVLLALILLSYAAERLAYRETDDVCRTVARVIESEANANRELANLRTPKDAAFGTLALARTWLEVSLFILLLALLKPGLPGTLALSVLIAGRFRALQELSHFAVHGALGGAPAYEMAIANLFFQFPMMRVDARARRRAHVAVHHRNSNVLGKDPNLDELKEAGVVPGCGTIGLVRGVLFPLWPRIALRNLRDGLSNCTSGSLKIILTRCTLVLCIGGSAYSLAGWPGVLFGLVLPRFLIYPWFAWVSQLLEHKWYAPMPEGRPFHREFFAGRQTRYGVVVGPLLRYLILPVGDSYHLAHSLFPRLRWNYLPVADRLLAAHTVAYTNGSSVGLLFAPDGAVNGASLGWLWKLSRLPGK